MKLAIIGGISEYTNQTRLNACKNDAETLRDFLTETGVYADICFIDPAAPGIGAKKLITDFIEKYRGNSVKELFFYFSGHGDRVGDDFFYALSDYKSDRREVTGLRNSELDSLIRNLSPELTVKIIDACYSGSSYIKSEDDLSPVVQKSAKDNELKKLYFLHSSAADEASIAGPQFSWFTEAIFNALAVQSGAVRYRDLIAAVADQMNRKNGPRPTFIMQADSLETFIHMDARLTQFLNKALGVTPVPSNTSGKDGSDDKSDEIEADAQSIEIVPATLAQIAAKRAADTYCTKEEAESNIAILSAMAVIGSWPRHITDSFDIIFAEAEADEVPNNLAIGRWIEKTVDDPVFAVPTYVMQAYKVEEYREVPKKPSSKLARMGAIDAFQRIFGEDKEYKLETVERSRKVIDGFEFNVPAVFKPHSICFIPRYSSLEHYSAWIVCLFSRRQVTCLYSVEHLPYKAWESTYAPQAAKWKQLAVSLKDAGKVETLCTSIIAEIVEFIETDARQRLAK